MGCLIPGWGWPLAIGRPAPGAARVLRAQGRQEVGDIGRRAFVADEAARKPASKPLSVSPCLRALRVDRPEGADGAGRRGRRPLPPFRPDTARRAMDPRARQPQNRSPCPCASARSVLTGRRPRTGRAAEDVGPYHRSAPTRDVPVRRMARRAMSPRRAVRRRGDVVRVKPSWRTRWRMKPRASQPQSHSPCPRVSARSVLTGRRARTGRAAEDVGPYHRSAPTRPGARWTRAPASLKTALRVPVPPRAPC